MLYNLYAGLGGGFGGANYIGTMECKSEDFAIDFAYEYARDIYDSYGGMHGLFNPDYVYDNPEDYGLEPDEEITEEILDELYLEDLESWVEYYAIPTDKDKNINKKDVEIL